MGRPVLLRSVRVGPKGRPAFSTYGFAVSLGCCLCKLQPQGLAKGLVEHPLTTLEDVELHLSFPYLINKCISCIPVDEVQGLPNKSWWAHWSVAVAISCRNSPVSWGVVHCGHLVVSIMTLKRLSDLFVCYFRDADIIPLQDGE